MGGVGAAAGPLDRWSHHHRDQLAGGVRVPGTGHRGDHLDESLDRRSHRARPDPPLRHARSGPVGRRAGPGRDGGARRRQRPPAHGGPVGRSGPSSSVVFFRHIRAREQRGRGAVAVDRAVPKPHLQPRARHPERPVAAAHRNRVRRLGVPAGRSRLQRHPNRRDLHRRDRRHPGVVTRRRATGQEVRATNAHHRPASSPRSPGSPSCSHSSRAHPARGPSPPGCCSSAWESA